MADPLGYVQARRLLQDGELADAIAAFLRTLEDAPDHVPSYFGLMKAYELAYEVLPDPELLHQVQNVLRGLREGELEEDDERRAAEIEGRIQEKLSEAGHPPPAPGRTPPG